MLPLHLDCKLLWARTLIPLLTAVLGTPQVVTKCLAHDYSMLVISMMLFWDWKVLSERDLSFWILKEKRWTQVGLLIQSGKLGKNKKYKVPGINDAQVCGLHRFCGIFETLCSAHLITFSIFNVGLHGAQIFSQTYASVPAPLMVSNLWDREQFLRPSRCVFIPTRTWGEAQSRIQAFGFSFHWPVKLSLTFLDIQIFLIM